jgi:hypothetical protein
MERLCQIGSTTLPQLPDDDAGNLRQQIFKTEAKAFEIDAQYVWNNIWTKFYTECAFNYNGDGTGYWAVYDGSADWMFLNNKNGAPNLPCNRSQFALPWAGSSDPCSPAGTTLSGPSSAAPVPKATQSSCR